MKPHKLLLSEFKLPKAENKGDKHLLKQIEKVGWTLIDIFQETEEEPGFAYTLGLYLRTFEPEVLIMGMNQQAHAYVLTCIAKHVSNGGKLPLEKRCTDIIPGTALYFRQVDFAHYREYLGFAYLFYASLRQVPPFFQCFWHDKNSFFPWDKGCRKEVKKLQRDLSKP
ncbi:MAG: hypothetical protein RIS79_2334 [Verrucomicrobiota bacterium]